MKERSKLKRRNDGPHERVCGKAMRVRVTNKLSKNHTFL